MFKNAREARGERGAVSLPHYLSSSPSLAASRLPLPLSLLPFPAPNPSLRSSLSTIQKIFPALREGVSAVGKKPRDPILGPAFPCAARQWTASTAARPRRAQRRRPCAVSAVGYSQRPVFAIGFQSRFRKTRLWVAAREAWAVGACAAASCTRVSRGDGPVPGATDWSLRRIQRDNLRSSGRAGQQAQPLPAPPAPPSPPPSPSHHSPATDALRTPALIHPSNPPLLPPPPPPLRLRAAVPPQPSTHPAPRHHRPLQPPAARPGSSSASVES